MAAQLKSALTILRRKQVEARTGLSRSTIYAKLRYNTQRPNDYDATFPKPIAIGAKAVGWIEAEIDAWLTAQVEKSRRLEGVSMPKKNKGIALAMADQTSQLN